MKKILTVALLNLMISIAFTGQSENLLDYADSCEFEGVVKAIQSGADINAKDKTGWTALVFASRCRSPQILKYLIDKGANLNLQTNFGCTALMHAASEGITENVKILLEKGADFNIYDSLCKSALWAAEKSGHKETADILRKAGAQK